MSYVHSYSGANTIKLVSKLQDDNNYENMEKCINQKQVNIRFNPMTKGINPNYY